MTGVLTSSDAFKGFGNTAVIGLAFIFPVAGAVEETGLLESVIGNVLGKPSSASLGLFELQVRADLFSISYFF